jgi:hypothetical protein
MEMDGLNVPAAQNTGEFTAQQDFLSSAMAQSSCNIVHRGYITEIPGEFLAAPEILTKA